MSMTLSELEDHGRITEVLCRVKKIEKTLDQILEKLSNNQPEPNTDTQEHNDFC